MKFWSFLDYAICLVLNILAANRVSAGDWGTAVFLWVTAVLFMLFFVGLMLANIVDHRSSFPELPTIEELKRDSVPVVDIEEAM